MYNKINYNGNKVETYEEIYDEIERFLCNEEDILVKMVSINSIIYDTFPYLLWVWFYLVKWENLLKVWPYQGTLWRIEILFSVWVCGACATKKEPVIVNDVNNFPWHIACDIRAKSELVMPVFGPDGKLLAVFDLDSIEVWSFDDVDEEWIGKIMRNCFYTQQI